MLSSHSELTASMPGHETAIGISSGSSSLPIKGEPTGDESSVSDDVFPQALVALSEMGQVNDQMAKRPRLT